MQTVYDELLYSGSVTNQSDFADQLGKTKGYVSTLLKSNEPPPASVRESLNDIYGFSIQWLNSNGKEGAMFARDGVNKRKSENQTVTKEFGMDLDADNIHTSPENPDPSEQTGENFSHTTNDQTMTFERVLGIAEKLAIATERDSLTRKSLAATLERMMNMVEESRMEVKKTDV